MTHDSTRYNWLSRELGSRRAPIRLPVAYATDIQNSGLHSFSENLNLVLKNQHFCLFRGEDEYVTSTHTNVQFNLATFGRILESNFYLQGSP